ncbi:MAG TPA: hypothetical protein VLI90_20175 [Tepidisphaeraceae bacterium]|nr:hypothetical protein [Tepidisphaeraceae bacterium]
MPKAPPIEQQLLELSGLRADATAPHAREKLAHAINGKNNLLAARAATVVTDTKQADYLPLLATAFDRFFASASDKGCAAKTAIANALYTLGHVDAQTFLRGVRHVQMEPTFGGHADAAAELRGICGLGLVRCGYRDALLELTSLLMDKEPQTRQMAVRAVVYAGHNEGAMLLRMKVLAGDESGEVIAEAFDGLMKLTPAKSLDFVARFLDDRNPATAESAAVAIGGSRTPVAYERLRQQWEHQIRPEPRRPLLLAIAMTRQPQAVEFLLERVREDSAKPASDAVAALGMYKHDDAVRTKLAAAVKERDDLLINEAFAKAF